MTIAPDRPATIVRTVDELPRPRRGWEAASACRDSDDDLLLNDRRWDEAKRVCGTCPVRWDCALNAFRFTNDPAVRGAMTQKERTAWLRDEGITVPGQTEVDLAAVARMREAGWNWPEIGLLYDLTGPAIEKRYARAITPRPGRRRPPGPSQADIDRALELRAGGATVKNIGLELGYSRQTIDRIFAKAKLEQE